MRKNRGGSHGEKKENEAAGSLTLSADAMSKSAPLLL
jgi:hypothetical protein